MLLAQTYAQITPNRPQKLVYVRVQLVYTSILLYKTSIPTRTLPDDKKQNGGDICR